MRSEKIKNHGEKTQLQIISKWSRSLKRKFSSYLNFNYRIPAILILGLFLSIYIFYMIFHYLFLKNHFDPVFGTMGKSCPACFGSKACPYFFRGEINIKGIYRLPFVQNFKSQQIYESYLGLYHRKTEVIIKKLATNQEHEETDLRICNINRYRNVEGKCHPKHALWYYLDYHPSKAMQLAHLAQTRDTAPMTYCVTERLLQRIKTKYRERDSSNVELPFSRREETLIIYTLNLNQQPLVLQLFPAEEGWPFPRYLGACGRWVVEEHAGRPMGEFCGAKLWQKLSILINLLQLPAKLDKSTENAGEWVLYIGDPDPENFMVDPVTFRVTIVDLEHVLVVDVQHLRQFRLENSNEPHRAKPEPCGAPLSPHYFNCTAAIDKAALCSRESSDHNIHSICAMLLTGDGDGQGLSAPNCLLNDDRLAETRQLLKRCVYEVDRRAEHRDAILRHLEQLLHATSKQDL